MIGTVIKQVLQNGLVILVVEQHDIPKVSVQLWYDVGAKHERSGQHGIAHFIEHMIFKGTETLSESDISALAHKLSGTCNAFTSQDYTGYLFDVPSQHWQEVLPTMADCMQHCTFKQEHLNSELKAVIQELKMYNDDYLSTLLERLSTALFYDHPYHHPVIGYKQDLWNLKREEIIAFYKSYYAPNNATMIIVGDVKAEDAFAEVEKAFGKIPPQKIVKTENWNHTFDVSAQQVTLYRDVQQPIILFTWTVPGVCAKHEYPIDLLSWIIGTGRGARLYVKLVTELGIATELQSFNYDLFDQSIFGIYVQPRSMEDYEQIRATIISEIESLRVSGISDADLQRAKRKTAVDFISLRENNQKLAYLLGKLYLATHDEKYLTDYLNQSDDALKAEMQTILQRYFAPSLMSSGFVLPLHATDKPLWTEQQKASDAEDGKVLSQIQRVDDVEKPSYSNNVAIEEPKPFNFPKPEMFELSNGLKVLYYNRPGVGKVDLILDLKAKYFYDPADKSGLSMLLADLLQEGTKNKSAQALATEIESYGMELNTFPGQVGMTMLSGDIQHGLELLREVLCEPSFTEEAIERIRAQLIAELALFWDNPTEFSAQIARQAVYQTHPIAQSLMGMDESISQLTREDVLAAYKRYITPREARLAIVGDFNWIDIKSALEATLGRWTGEPIAEPTFPTLAPPEPMTIDYPINRDQCVLAYAGLSIERMNRDFDPLLMFDQIFGGGVLNSMNSRLFDIRERTGLFYAINGSVIAGTSLHPGLVFIKGIVSHDRLAQAETAIEELIAEGAKNISDADLHEARAALVNSFVDHYASNRQIAATFISLDIYHLPFDYFDTRGEALKKVTKSEIQQAVARVLDPKHLVKIRVGRLDK